MPECSDCLSARTSTSTATRPRSAVVIDGRPVSKLPVSVRTMASAASSFLCARRNSVEVRRADLLLALDDDLDVERQRAGGLEPGVDGAGVHDHAGLVVGGAARRRGGRRARSARTAATSTRRRRRPAARRGARREDRRRARRLQDLAVDVGVRAGELEQLHVLEAALAQELRRRFGRAAHLLGSKPSNETLGMRTSVFRSSRYASRCFSKCWRALSVFAMPRK